MSNKRTEIREAIKQVLLSSLAYPVYAGRDVDATDLSEFANVYILDGESIFSGLIKRHESLFVVSYRNSDDLTDEQLDIFGDEIEAALAAASFGDVMHGIVYTGFAYLEERERGFDGIDLRYTIYY